MQTVLIVIHLMVVIALVAVVLLQRSEGGALGVSGFMTGRGQANVLTRATAILATLFFATSLALTILANLNRAPKSILESVTPSASTSAPAGAPEGKGNLLDDLKKIEEQRQHGSQPPEAPSSQ
jgi:preprotein translocase subunit SecG